MKSKKFIIFTLALCFMVQLMGSAFAANNSYVRNAIRKYKRGNYSGCMQDLQYYTRKDPSNAMAYYYLAMSYARAGKKTQAINSYKKVLALSSNRVLYNYASKGKRCLETPDKCDYVDASKPSELDKVISSPGYMAPTVTTQVEQQRLNTLRQQINTNGYVNGRQIRKVDPNSSSKLETKDKVALNDEATSISTKVAKVDENKKPTNAEIVAAIKVLNKAGLINLDESGVYSTALTPQNNNSEMAQLSAMMGKNGSNGNNSMANMLPYLMMQGQNGQNSAMSKEAMQALMMNSMLPDVNFTSNDENK